MERIYEKILASRVPVIVYVSPQGAGAASAGVFVAEAADVLAMAPATNIGSSTPINQSGGNLGSDLRRKDNQPLRRKAGTLAETNGRNGDWAASAVRTASNLTIDQALKLDVIDLKAPNLRTLLDQPGRIRDLPPPHRSTPRTRRSSTRSRASSRASSTSSSTRTSSRCSSWPGWPGSDTRSSIPGSSCPACSVPLRS